MKAERTHGCARGALLVDLVLALAVLGLVLVPLLLELHGVLGREGELLAELRLHEELRRLRTRIAGRVPAADSAAAEWRFVDGSTRIEERVHREEGSEAEIDVILIEVREGPIQVVARVPVARAR